MLKMHLVLWSQLPEYRPCHSRGNFSIAKEIYQLIRYLFMRLTVLIKRNSLILVKLFPPELGVVTFQQVSSSNTRQRHTMISLRCYINSPQKLLILRGERATVTFRGYTITL